MRVAQKNVIEEKLLEIKRSIRRGIYLFQIHSGHFSDFLCINTDKSEENDDTCMNRKSDT